MQNETKQLNETKNVSPGCLEVGREYLIRAPGVCVLAVYTGMAEPPGDDRERTMPRFWPVTWIRCGEDIDPVRPIYAGHRARWRAVEVSGGVERPAVTRGRPWARFLAALGHLL